MAARAKSCELLGAMFKVEKKFVKHKVDSSIGDEMAEYSSTRSYAAGELEVGG